MGDRINRWWNETPWVSNAKDAIENWWNETRWVSVATLNALRNADIEHYPEVCRDGELVDLRSEQLVPELVGATNAFKRIKGCDASITVDEALELVRLSLEECKKQTEYQDDKASRLLTVTSFVSALSAALFASFLDRYPIDKVHPLLHIGHWWLIFTYVAFAFFTLFALCGALVTFHATRTRFKYTSDKQISDENKPPSSMLFYKGIIGAAPRGWAREFLARDERGDIIQDKWGSASLRPDLKTLYLRHYVIETYLVAAKTADKLRYLGPAQALLSWAMRLLVLFVALFFIAIMAVSSLKPEPKAAPIVIKNAPPTVTVRTPAPVIIPYQPGEAEKRDPKGPR